MADGGAGSWGLGFWWSGDSITAGGTGFRGGAGTSRDGEKCWSGGFRGDEGVRCTVRRARRGEMGLTCGFGV